MINIPSVNPEMQEVRLSGDSICSITHLLFVDGNECVCWVEVTSHADTYFLEEAWCQCLVAEAKIAHTTYNKQWRCLRSCPILLTLDVLPAKCHCIVLPMETRLGNRTYLLDMHSETCLVKKHGQSNTHELNVESVSNSKGAQLVETYILKIQTVGNTIRNHFGILDWYAHLLVKVNRWEYY